MIASGWQAANEVRVGVGHDAGQHGDPEAGTDARQQAAGRCVVHRDLALQAERLQPVLVVDPEVSATTPDKGVLPELGEGRRNAVPRGIVAAAIERPIVDAELAADQSRRLVFSLGASQRYVRLYGETRHYVQRVIYYYNKYKTLYPDFRAL